jgi:hypothetical protein
VQRVVLHYLSGRINVEVFLPLECVAGEAEAEALQRELQQALVPLAHFGKVRLYFG